MLWRGRLTSIAGQRQTGPVTGWLAGSILNGPPPPRVAALIRGTRPPRNEAALRMVRRSLRRLQPDPATTGGAGLATRPVDIPQLAATLAGVLADTVA